MLGLPGVISGIRAALPIFHEHGIYPSANLGINRDTGGKMESSPQLAEKDPEKYYEAFKKAFSEFYAFIEELGFTIVNVCYPMSINVQDVGELNAVYAATSEDDIVSFLAVEKILIFKALSDTIPLYRSKIRIFTPRVSLFALIRQYENDRASNYPCHGGIDFFFISAKDGNTYPCGYRGNESLGKFLNFGFEDIKYNRACDYYDGRKAPDYQRLEFYSS